MMDATWTRPRCDRLLPGQIVSIYRQPDFQPFGPRAADLFDTRSAARKLHGPAATRSESRVSSRSTCKSARAAASRAPPPGARENARVTQSRDAPDGAKEVSPPITVGCHFEEMFRKPMRILHVILQSVIFCCSRRVTVREAHRTAVSCLGFLRARQGPSGPRALVTARPSFFVRLRQLTDGIRTLTGHNCVRMQTRADTACEYDDTTRSFSRILSGPDG